MLDNPWMETSYILWFYDLNQFSRSQRSKCVIGMPFDSGGTFCNRWCYWAQSWCTCSPQWLLLWDWIVASFHSSIGHQGVICKITKLGTACWYFHARYSYSGHITYPLAEFIGFLKVILWHSPTGRNGQTWVIKCKCLAMWALLVCHDHTPIECSTSYMPKIPAANDWQHCWHMPHSTNQWVKSSN